MQAPVAIIDLGLIDYLTAEALQGKALEWVRNGGSPVLLLLEHTPTITFGRNGGAENLPFGKDYFTKKGVAVVQASRGGNITCHFPGQLVAYPFLAIDKRPGGLKRFVHDMEEVILQTLAHFGVTAHRQEGRPGVWIQNRKIASIGIALKHWITSHGISLNIGRDLALFEEVTPCGLPGVRATSLHLELGDETVTMEKVKKVFTKKFCSVFAMAPKEEVEEALLTAGAPTPCCAGKEQQPAAIKDELPLRLPAWLRRPLPKGKEFIDTRSLVNELDLSTVCKGAKCPNMHECFSAGTATFLILGDTCTRNCAFCNIAPGNPGLPDPSEPIRVAEAAARLGLAHVVITSVTRDDMEDGGSAHFAATIKAVRSALPNCTIEVLIPDFKGSEAALNTVIAAAPDVINHNVETHPALYAQIRPQAKYAQSLELLRRVHATGIPAKSGFMVGLGENDEQVAEVLRDLHEAGCSMVTIGQYLRPSSLHVPVRRYVHPDTFTEYATLGTTMGIRYVFSAPLVRSSYQAGESLAALKKSRDAKQHG